MWQTIRTSSLEHHVHAEPYAALVLSGGYEEAGDDGRFQVAAGSVVFHDRFDAHLNRFCEDGAMVLNLRLDLNRYCTPGIVKVADPDFVVQVAERDPRAAVDLLLSTAERWTPQAPDWPDELATKLRENPSLKLSQWAAENGLAPWAVSRGFAQVFGVSPEAYRGRVRARRALRLIQFTQMPLAMIAADIGFSDQAHMTRGVKQLTGVAPQAWRLAANAFKTRANMQLRNNECA